MSADAEVSVVVYCCGDLQAVNRPGGVARETPAPLGAEGDTPRVAVGADGLCNWVYGRTGKH